LATTLNAIELVADELGLGAAIEPFQSAWNVHVRVSHDRHAAFVVARLMTESRLCGGTARIILT
jgi:hypothetical protein